MFNEVHLLTSLWVTIGDLQLLLTCPIWTQSAKRTSLSWQKQGHALILPFLHSPAPSPMPTQIGTFRSSNTLGIKFSPSSWIDGYGPSKSVASFSWPGRSMWMKMDLAAISLMHGDSMKSWKTEWFEPMSCTVRKMARFSFSFRSPVWKRKRERES